MIISISDILILRPLKLSDADSITKHANNKNVWKSLTDLFPNPYILHDAIKFINSQNEVYPTAVFAIVYNNEVIGTIGISVNKENEKLCGDIGYWIGEDFWNQGIVTSSIKTIIKYGFETFSQIDCVSASVFTNNFASIKALEKSKLNKEKKIKNAILKAGEKKDIYLFKITREKFNEFRPI